MGNLWQDVRFALRGLRRNPGFAAVAVLTLGLGIGATTAVFTVTNDVVLEPLPFAEPERLVMVWEQNLSQNIERDSPSPPNYTDWRHGNRTFLDLAAVSDGSVTLSGLDQPQVIQVAYPSANLFTVLGVRAQLGRVFTERDAADTDAPILALISHGMWGRRFGADPDVLGRTVRLNATPVEIVGVMPPEFTVPRSDIDLWVPTNHENPSIHRQSRYLRVYGRLRPEVTAEQARADLDGIQRRIAESFPESNQGWGTRVVAAQDEVVGASTRRILMLLLGAVGFVLLIACANVANLLLGRSTNREREISVRTALGASRGRVVSQLLTESAVLAIVGGGLGVLLALAGVRALVALDPQGLPRIQEVAMDGASLGFAFAASLLTALLFGLAPALHAARRSVSDTLKGATAVTAGTNERTRSALVVAQVGVSLTLLVGAGLLVRSLIQMGRVDPGFEPEGVSVARVSLGAADYPDNAARVPYFDEMQRRLREIPGVEAAGVTMVLPMDPSGIDFDLPYHAEGHPALPEGELPQTDYRVVSDGYFQTMRMDLVEGREITSMDRPETGRVLVINETFAKQLWPNESAIGKAITIYYVNEVPWEVVGVVEDNRHRGLGAPAPPQMFVPLAQADFVFNYMHFAVRSVGDPGATVREVRRVGVEVDPKYPLFAVTTMDAILAATTERDRFVTTLLGAFALLALTLAAVGIHGVMAYQVARRTREIGLRMALGADRGSVLKVVLGRAALMAGLGVVLGLGGATLTTRAVRSLLFEVSPVDPVTYAGVGGLLLLVACLAALVPAVRAARMDPAGALRVD